MKTMYITEDTARLLRESILADSIPEEIMVSIDKTPCGNNPLFMGNAERGNRFFKKMAASRFESARKALKNIGTIDSVDADTVESAFQKIVLKCQEIEDKNRDKLEKLAVNYVIDLFSVPDNTVLIEGELVKSIEDGDEISPVEPFDGEAGFEVRDIEEYSHLDLEILKRYFLNMLNMGAGMRMSENVRGYLEEIYEIDSRLPELYKEALALNDYLLFKSPDLGISDNSRNQIGLVCVKYGSSQDMVRINARGIIFPILLCELIRGFMELFSAHGLPKQKDRMEYVLKKADYLKAEPWQMRFGPELWNIFTEYFEDTDTSDMPYIYQVLSKLKPEMFFKVLSEMMAKTEKGKIYAEKITEKALNNKEQTSFTNKMTKRKDDKGIITDNCMRPEEF